MFLACSWKICCTRRKKSFNLCIVNVTSCPVLLNKMGNICIKEPNREKLEQKSCTKKVELFIIHPIVLPLHTYTVWATHNNNFLCSSIPFMRHKGPFIKSNNFYLLFAFRFIQPYLPRLAFGRNLKFIFLSVLGVWLSSVMSLCCCFWIL